ncbi:MAG: glycosyltransferase, partial [Saprospiraceae bacterium]|nr:glycosyltransferase [Saprospiraceae bacterium]
MNKIPGPYINPKIRKIGLTLTSLASGGAEKQCLLLASMLQNYYEVLVIVVDDKPKHKIHLSFISDHKLKVIFLKGMIPKKITQLRRLVKREGIDLILSYLPKDIILTSLAVGSKVSFHVGGIRNARMNIFKRNILKEVHNRKLVASISNCHSGKDFFSRNGFESSKITVIPNGIKIDTTPIQRADNGKITITSLGRLVDQKDYLTAIRSIGHLLKLVAEKDLQVQYRIVGDGPDRVKIQQQINRLGLSPYITIHTEVTEIPEILKGSDIYLCTSLYEGVSNAIMEAMVHSLPIVATDAGDNSILVRNNINGYVLRQRDEIGIGNALERLIHSSTLRRRMGAASFEHISSEFNL